MDLKGKVALITGASSGIGRDIAIGLAKEGCKLVIVGTSENRLKEVENEIKKNRSQVLLLIADLNRKESIDLIIKETLKVFKKINIIINNAGVLFDSDFLDITEEQWDITLNVNLKAAFLLSQKVLSIMKEQNGGYIINISSTAALEVPAGIAAYGISKLGLVGLSNALYEEGKKYNVKVSTIYPGMTDTPMLRKFNPPVSADKWMLPADITECVTFLLKQSDRVIVKEMIPWARKYDKI